MKNRKIMIASALTACVLVLGGCGNAAGTGTQEPEKNGNDAEAVQETGAQGETSSEKSDEPVTLRVAWWGNQERNDRTVRMLEFSRRHRYIRTKGLRRYRKKQETISGFPVLVYCL